MPAKNPRLNVVVDKHTYSQVRSLAVKDGVPLATKVRDLLKDALEIHEDTYLASIADEREVTWSDAEALCHDETWS